jgi:predicted double-glycine peptidase
MRRVAVSLAALVLCACAGGGTARSVKPAAIQSEPGWIAVGDIALVRQTTRTNCGEAALATVLGFWKMPATMTEIEIACPSSSIDDDRLRAGELRDAARKRGLEAFLVSAEMSDLETQLRKGRPVLVGVVRRHGIKHTIKHYEVVVAINPEAKRVVLLDPAKGWREDSFDGFLSEWTPASKLALVAFR